MYKVLLPSSLSPAAFAHAAQRTDVVVESFPPAIAPNELRARLVGVDGIGLSLNRFGAEELAAGPSLKVVARHGVGYDTVDVPALTAAAVPLMVTGPVNAVTVAEFAMGMMFALLKRSGRQDSMVREGRWAERLVALPIELAGRALLIVGFGAIGRRLASRCLALEMRVLVHDAFVTEAQISALGCVPAPDLAAAVCEADIVSIHCPKTPETTGLFGKALLARMKPSAVLINTSRGGIVDEAALAAALASSGIAGAGLDVFDSEPLAAGSPLLTAPNLLLAPHVAGLSAESMVRMGVVTVDNILSVLDGHPLTDNVVNKSVLVSR
jgi:D-3-phosphoglycerate dehydrogenase